jgi:hypothetical protein
MRRRFPTKRKSEVDLTFGGRFVEALSCLTMNLPKWLVAIIHYGILLVTFVAGLTQLPQVAQQLGLSLVTHYLTLAVAGAGWICTYFLKSPLVIGWLSLHDPADVANAANLARLKKKSIPPLPVFLMVASMMGCLPVEPIVPVTAANQSQVKACESIGDVHNGLVWGDMTIGVGAGTLGTIAAALPSEQAKTDLAVTAAAIAFLTAVGTGTIALETQAFTNDQCPTFVGSLPVAGALDAGVNKP